MNDHIREPIGMTVTVNKRNAFQCTDKVIRSNGSSMVKTALHWSKWLTLWPPEETVAGHNQRAYGCDKSQTWQSGKQRPNKWILHYHGNQVKK